MTRTAPRTPVGEVDLGIVDALAQLSFAVYGVLGPIGSAHDLSIVQVRLLGLLRDRRPTITDLARFLRLDKSSVTGLVDRAQERGLVERIASTLDRRSVLVAITGEGRSLIRQVVTECDAELAVLVSALTPAQRVRLSRLASRVAIADGLRRGVGVLDDVECHGDIGSAYTA